MDTTQPAVEYLNPRLQAANPGLRRFQPRIGAVRPWLEGLWPESCERRLWLERAQPQRHTAEILVGIKPPSLSFVVEAAVPAAMGHSF